MSGIQLKLHGDLKKLQRTLKLEQKTIQRHTPLILNKMMTQNKKQVVSLAKEAWGRQVTSKRLKPFLYVHRASRHHWCTQMSVSTLNPRLLRLDPKAKQLPAGVKVKTALGPSVLAHTFLQHVHGHPRLLERIGAPRYPVEDLITEKSLPQIIRPHQGCMEAKTWAHWQRLWCEVWEKTTFKRWDCFFMKIYDEELR